MTYKKGQLFRFMPEDSRFEVVAIDDTQDIIVFEFFLSHEEAKRQQRSAGPHVLIQHLSNPLMGSSIFTKDQLLNYETAQTVKRV